MQYPYLITSDQHCHAWSAFSKTNPDGVNSRLQVILDELARAHIALSEADGTVSFYGGDLFHVRGKIEPSVFNPTFERIKSLHVDTPFELESHAIPGNHDLEGNEASELGNAMQQLGTIDGFTVHTEPELVGDVLVIPWIKDLAHLRAVLKKWAEDIEEANALPMPSKIDLIIHAPLNGVIKGLPDHGLDPVELANLGFRRVFCGHYHNHVETVAGVYSIGATTHQTWSDPGTKAGFLLVYEDRVEFHESQAPKFIDLVSEMEGAGDDMETRVKGNYVRMKLVDVEPKDIRAWRDDLIEAGALGVNIIEVKTASVTRTGASAKAAISLEASVQHYIENDQKPLLLEEVSKAAMEVLEEARA